MWFNPLMIWLIRSRFHRWISNSVLLLSYTGKKSGKTFEVPVNYLSLGDDLYTISLADRMWWRNFRTSTPVKLLLAGKTVPAQAMVFEDPESVSEVLAAAARRNPRYGRFLRIGLAATGEPDAEQTRQAASGRVAVRYQLLG